MIRAVPGGFDRIYVINLARRQDRFVAMTTQLAACGFDVARQVVRYEAVDGSRADAATLVRRGLISPLGMKRLQRPESQRIWGMDLTPGGVGCALSHADIWSRVAALNLNKVLVLEDDCLIQPSFAADFDAAWLRVETHPIVRDDWGLVYLSGLDTENRGHLLEVQPGLRLVPRMHRTTNAYVLRASGARQLMDACLPLTFQLDTEMTTRISTQLSNGEFAVTGVPCYSLHPPLIVQATRFGSDIQGGVSHDTRQEEVDRCRAAGWTSAPSL